MKNTITSLLILIGLIVGIACNNNTKNDTPIHHQVSTSDSISIIKGVVDATTNFEQYYNTKDSEHLKEYWAYNDPDFKIIANSNVYPKGADFEQMLQEYWSQAFDTTSLTWTKKEIIPITEKYAHLQGEFDIFIAYENGDTINYTVYYTALYKKIGHAWKALHVHESYNTENTN